MRILMISARRAALQASGRARGCDGRAAKRAARARGHEVSVALAVLQREIKENRALKKTDTGITVDVQVGDQTYVARYLEGRAPAACSMFCWSLAMNFLIVREFTASAVSRTKIMPRDLLSSAKQRTS
jgi:hypothetical protein